MGWRCRVALWREMRQMGQDNAPYGTVRQGL